jgi:hypothetical protein
MTTQCIMSAPALLVRVTDLCNIAMIVTSYRTQEINKELNTIASTISEFWKEGNSIYCSSIEHHQNALGTQPKDGNVIPKHVGATIHN